MHDDCDNEWLYEDLEDDAMMDLLIGDIVGENDLQQSNISNNIKSQKSMRIIRKNTDGAYEIYDPLSQNIVELPLDYINVGQFCYGFAVTCVESECFINDNYDNPIYKRVYGLINIDGKCIVAPYYTRIRILNCQFAEVEYAGETRLINFQGQIQVYRGNNPVFIPSEYIWGWNYQDGLACVKSVNNHYFFINIKGDVIINVKEGQPESFVNGYAKITNNYGECIFITTTGEIKIHNGPQIIYISSKYAWAWDFHNGLARVKLNSKYGYVNINNEEIIPLQYTYASDFFNGLAIVELDCKYGCINTLGAVVVPIEYDEIQSFTTNGAVVRIGGRPPCTSEAGNFIIGGKYGLLDNNGKLIVPARYEYIGPFRNGWAVVIYKQAFRNLKGYINLAGSLVVQNAGRPTYVPSKYNWGWDFSEGLARVLIHKEVDLYGFVDIYGNEVIPPKYQYAENFSEGLACVYNGIKYGYVDKNGYEIIPLKYDEAGNFSDGLAKVRIGGKYGKYSPILDKIEIEDARYGYINNLGIERIPILYSHANDFSEGLAAVCMHNKWGFINRTGNVVVPLKYDCVHDFKSGFAQVFYNGKKLGINMRGEEFDIKFIELVRRLNLKGTPDDVD